MDHSAVDQLSYLVLGSMCAHPKDRSMDRANIIPVQLVHKGERIPLRYFDEWGKLGVSAMAWNENDPERIYMTTGDDLKLLCLDRGKVEEYDLQGLKDIHELTLLGDQLWAANTGRDEVLAFDTRTRKIKRRVSLRDLLDRKNSTAAADSKSIEIDKFHCNQVCSGFDGKLYLLVHHVTGKQVVKKIAQKLLKLQGEGGVICLDDHRRINLKLKAPHSIRCVNDEYWIFDSGNSTLKIHDASWTLKKVIDTESWGRGADISQDGKYFIAGVSQTRKRYITKNTVIVANMVKIYSAADYALVGEVEMKEIEQINNIYSVTDRQVQQLLKLR